VEYIHIQKETCKNKNKKWENGTLEKGRKGGLNF
jgi:hypothetical protein